MIYKQSRVWLQQGKTPINQIETWPYSAYAIFIANPRLGSTATAVIFREDIRYLLQYVFGHERASITEKSFTAFQSICEECRDNEDPRSIINRRYLFDDLIVISTLAVVAVGDNSMAIATKANHQEEWLKQHLGSTSGIPLHDILNRTLRTIKPEAFLPCFQSQTSRFSEKHGLSETNKTAIDEQTFRRSHDNGRSLGSLFLASAQSVEHSRSPGQLATEEQ